MSKMLKDKEVKGNVKQAPEEMFAILDRIEE